MKSDTKEDRYTELKLDEIISNDSQPRKFFDEQSLSELAESIKKNGIIQPIIVRRYGKKYQIIAGERRFRAAKIAGLDHVPVVIKSYENRQTSEIALVENIQRDNLNPLEEALAYKNLIDNYGYKHDELSPIVGKSRSYVTNYLRLLSLPEPVKDYIKDGKITMGHAKLLVNLEDSERIAEIIVRKSLSVRQTEDFVKNLSYNKSKSNAKKSNEVKLLEEKLSQSLGLKVVVTDNNDKYGSIKIIFNDLKELETILKRLS